MLCDGLLTQLSEVFLNSADALRWSPSCGIKITATAMRIYNKISEKGILESLAK